VLAQARRFDAVTYEHVRRERNTEADRLANEGVDAWLAARR
jgi:ribonuclease HI